MTGVIFDLKRFAVHDGEGLRSTLFLKGCPLHCKWCQNPESISAKSAVWYSPADCIGCGLCVKACSEKLLTFSENRVHQNDGCALCGECVDACPAAARRIIGEEIAAEEAAKRLMRDRIFFGSDGGVTLSGGETLLQWQFASEVLRRCKEEGVDTAIETCLFAKKEALDAMIPVTDHFIVDIKVLDPELHKKYTGADNALILENFTYLAEKEADLLVRTPLIPGFTAADENIAAIARFIRQVKQDVRYELLNFNPLCKSKYAAMEQDYPVQGNALTQSELDHFYEILACEGITYIVKES